jgi:hypothetical protein
MIVNLLSAEVTISPALAYYPPGASYGPRTLSDFELVWLSGWPRNFVGGQSSGSFPRPAR